MRNLTHLAAVAAGAGAVVAAQGVVAAYRSPWGQRVRQVAANRPIAYGVDVLGTLIAPNGTTLSDVEIHGVTTIDPAALAEAVAKAVAEATKPTVGIHLDASAGPVR